MVGLIALLVLAVTVVPVPGATGAAHGRRSALDPTFGRHGRVLAVPPPETEPTVFAAAAREPNGDVLLDLHRHPLAQGTARELELRRPNGELDPSFGTHGRLAVGPGKGLAVLPDGDALVVGGGCHARLSSVMMIGPDGAPVKSFGDQGCAPYVGFDVDHIAVDAEGRILLGGSSQYCSPCTKDTVPSTEFSVARLLPDGSLDRSFGKDGIVNSHADLELKAPGFFEQLTLEGLAASPDGGVLVSAGDEVIRLGPSGALDPVFGAGGVAAGPDHHAGPVVVQPDGSIDLVSVDTTEDALFVTKFGPQGNVEAGFGEGGTKRIVTPSGLEQYELLAAAAPAGALVVASREAFPENCPRPCTPTPFLVRLTATGQPDPAYGVGGVTTIGPSPSSLLSPDRLNAILVAPDGSTLVLGDDWEGDALATAMTATGAPDPALGGTGTLVEHRKKPTQLGPVGLTIDRHGRLAMMNDRSEAPGYLVGHLLYFGRDGKQLRAPDGSRAITTGFHGSLIPIAGGFLVWEEFEVEREHIAHAITPDGRPLTSFGTAGTVQIPPKLVPKAVALSPDGGVVVVGTSGQKAMVIYRLGRDGKPLPGFGHGGLAFAFRGDYTIAEDALVEADGDTVVTGWAGLQAAAARLRPDGKLDPTFGDRGLARGLIKPESSGELIAPWPGGGTVIAALREGKEHHKSILLTRLDHRGHRVRAFGRGGMLREGAEYRPLALLVSGRRIVVVTTYLTKGGVYHHGVELRAFLPDGAVDKRFGDDGVAIYGSGGRGAYFLPTAAVAQPGGRVVVAGTANYGHGRTKAELVRFRVP